MSDAITKGSESSDELTPPQMRDVREWVRHAKEDCEKDWRDGKMNLVGFMKKSGEIDTVLP